MTSAIASRSSPQVHFRQGQDCEDWARQTYGASKEEQEGTEPHL